MCMFFYINTVYFLYKVFLDGRSSTLNNYNNAGMISEVVFISLLNNLYYRHSLFL